LDIVAVLCVRNELGYLANCLSHLSRNGIKYAVIDHGSTDGSLDLLAQPRFAKDLVGRWNLPYNGLFELARQIDKKEQCISELKPDWAIHQDADEVLHSRVEGESLCDAIARVDKSGANAINFDEFVFLPVDQPYRPDCDGWQPLRWYYYYHPPKHKLIRARKEGCGLTMERGTGHTLYGDLHLAGEEFALRHYLFRDQQHAYSKYANRRFSAAEMKQAWHLDRHAQWRKRFKFPDPSLLQVAEHASKQALDRTYPKVEHYWRWSAGLDSIRLRHLLRILFG